MRVLVVNAGSSSLKLTLLGDQDETIAAREIPAPRAALDHDALRAALHSPDSPLREADAVGHRIVHGGERFREPVRVDGGVREALRELVDLAPLHQPKSLAALDAVSQALPGVPAVACFDTAFHGTLPPEAATYALPAVWRERWGLRRYGFHGLSHAWVARRTPELLEKDGTGPPTRDSRRPGPGPGSGPGPRIVSCHLGAGASVCAIENGRSRETTMGFTPLEGLVMATRSGSVDPGLLLWLLEHTGMSEGELGEALEHESGLVGLTGSADMREILARARGKDEKAKLGLDVYIHRLRAGVAAMAAALGGLDVLVFTGGVGEHESQVRANAVAGLSFLGVSLDEARNREADGDAEVGCRGAAVRTLVIAAREDLEIARQVRGALRA